jgi:hypothetical protein
MAAQPRFFRDWIDNGVIADKNPPLKAVVPHDEGNRIGSKEFRKSLRRSGSQGIESYDRFQIE